MARTMLSCSHWGFEVSAPPNLEDLKWRIGIRNRCIIPTSENRAIKSPFGHPTLPKRAALDLWREEHIHRAFKSAFGLECPSLDPKNDPLHSGSSDDWIPIIVNPNDLCSLQKPFLAITIFFNTFHGTGGFASADFGLSMSPACHRPQATARPSRSDLETIM